MGGIKGRLDLFRKFIRFGTDARPQLLAQSNAANAQNYINFMTSVRQSKRLFSSGINVLLLNEVKGRMFDFILSTVL